MKKQLMAIEIYAVKVGKLGTEHTVLQILTEYIPYLYHGQLLYSQQPAISTTMQLCSATPNACVYPIAVDSTITDIIVSVYGTDVSAVTLSNSAGNCFLL